MNAHIIPRTYLKHFCNNNGDLMVIAKHINKNWYQNIKPKPKKPESVCYEKDYFKLRTVKDKTKENIIEDFFCKEFESKYDFYYEKIIKLANKPIVIIPKNIANYWFRYCAYQVFRTRESIENTIQYLYSQRDDIYKNMSNDEKRDCLLFMMFIKQSENEQSQMEEFANILKNTHQIEICKNTSATNFITSDNPIYVHFNSVKFEYFGKLSTYEDAILFLPISPKIMLKFSPKKLVKNKKDINFDDDAVNFINDSIIFGAEKYIISKEFTNNNIEFIKNSMTEQREKYENFGLLMNDDFQFNKQKVINNLNSIFFNALNDKIK